MTLDKLAIQPVYAAELHQTLTVDELKQFAHTTAINNQIDPTLFLGIAECESHWQPTVQSKFYYKGYRERSFGIFQIHLTAHHDVSYEQAIDPYFNIQWAAAHFQTPWDDWKTCYSEVLK